MLHRGAVKRVLRTHRLAKGQWTIEFEDGSSVEAEGTVLLLVQAPDISEDEGDSDGNAPHSFTGMRLV